MKRTTKLSLAAGAVALVGIGAAVAVAQADHRGGWRGSHHGGDMMRHHGGPRMGGWHRRKHRHRRMARLMERFDTNADGKLTQKELNESRRALLAKFDTNKDGKLTLKEFEGLWLEFMQRRMVRSFQRLDVDGDSTVTLDEYLKPFARIVERFDRNEDGALSRDDRRWRRWHRRGGDGPGAGRGGPGGGAPATPPSKN